MTVQLDVPTGAEARAHVERWEALPEGERPRYPIERWLPYVQRWEGRIPQGLSVAVHRIPDDDTPQPGLRLVPLPVPVGDGWRAPVDEPPTPEQVSRQSLADALDDLVERFLDDGEVDGDVVWGLVARWALQRWDKAVHG